MPLGTSKGLKIVATRSDGTKQTSFIDAETLASMRAENQKCDRKGFYQAIRDMVGEELPEQIMCNASVILRGPDHDKLLDLDQEGMVRRAGVPMRARSVPAAWTVAT